MKKIILRLIKLYFTIFSRIFPKITAKQAFNLFQKPTKRAYKPNEIDFYNKAKHYKLDYQEESLDVYELGSENKKLVFIVHGWGSNLGRLSKIAFRLEKEGYRVVGMNFPAHGNSKLTKTNMVFSKNAFVNLVKRTFKENGSMNQQQEFSIVSHSFGSSVSALAMKEMGLKVKRLIFLTSANKTSELFLDYKKMINLSDNAFDILLKMSKEKVNLDFMKLNIQDVLADVKYEKLLVIHDRFDKMLPYHFATEIVENTRNSELMTLENKGHSGMLFEEVVINRVVSFISLAS